MSMTYSVLIKNYDIIRKEYDLGSQLMKRLSGDQIINLILEAPRKGIISKFPIQIITENIIIKIRNNLKLNYEYNFFYHYWTQQPKNVRQEHPLKLNHIKKDFEGWERQKKEEFIEHLRIWKMMFFTIKISYVASISFLIFLIIHYYSNLYFLPIIVWMLILSIIFFASNITDISKQKIRIEYNSPIIDDFKSYDVSKFMAWSVFFLLTSGFLFLTRTSFQRTISFDLNTQFIFQYFIFMIIIYMIFTLLFLIVYYIRQKNERAKLFSAFQKYIQTKSDLTQENKYSLILIGEKLREKEVYKKEFIIYIMTILSFILAIFSTITNL